MLHTASLQHARRGAWKHQKPQPELELFTYFPLLFLLMKKGETDEIPTLVSTSSTKVYRRTPAGATGLRNPGSPTSSQKLEILTHSNYSHNSQKICETNSFV